MECEKGISHRITDDKLFNTNFCVAGLIWGEINSLYSSGIADYIGDLWNIIDFISNTFYVTWIGLRITSWYVVQVSQAIIVYSVLFCCVVFCFFFLLSAIPIPYIIYMLRRS